MLNNRDSLISGSSSAVWQQIQMNNNAVSQTPVKDKFHDGGSHFIQWSGGINNLTEKYGPEEKIGIPKNYSRGGTEHLYRVSELISLDHSSDGQQ